MIPLFTLRLWALLLVLGLFAGPGRAQRIAAGYEHTVAVRPDGTLWTWGSNYYSQLGTGTAGGPTLRTTPVQVGTATNWQSVSAGYYHTLAIRTDGTLWAWGNNSVGRQREHRQPTGPLPGGFFSKNRAGKAT